MQLLARMLPELKRRGHKVLIFSQMTRVLDLLERWLEHLGWQHSRLDGSTPQAERQALITNFSTDPEQAVFLLSTRAGGLGINLTAADTVIIYDSDWNPQQDLQAQDRAHRLGQQKTVCVFRLCTAGSVESRVLAAASGKLKLERLVVIDRAYFTPLEVSPRLGRQQGALASADLQAVLEAELGDVRAGSGERPISDPELMQLLDRDELLRLHEAKEKAQAGEEPQAQSLGGFDFIEEAEAEF